MHRNFLIRRHPHTKKGDTPQQGIVVLAHLHMQLAIPANLQKVRSQPRVEMLQQKETCHHSPRNQQFWHTTAVSTNKSV
jgi:hypothetical protein